MKLIVSDEVVNGEQCSQHTHILDVSGGLFGFPDIQKMELFYDVEELPFMWLREDNQDGLIDWLKNEGNFTANGFSSKSYYTEELKNGIINKLNGL